MIIFFLTDFTGRYVLKKILVNGTEIESIPYSVRFEKSDRQTILNYDPNKEVNVIPHSVDFQRINNESIYFHIDFNNRISAYLKIESESDDVLNIKEVDEMFKTLLPFCESEESRLIVFWKLVKKIKFEKSNKLIVTSLAGNTMVYMKNNTYNEFVICYKKFIWSPLLRRRSKNVEG